MPGQRWASETQPELGLGLVVRADNARVQVHFPAAGEMLTYASRGAPLRRVAFAEGDAIKSHEGHSMRVAAVREEKGLLVYADESGAEMPETALSDTISFQKPEARLLARQVDDLRTWDLRQQALRHRHKSRFRWTRGLAGGRISLIPHQLYIASEVANRVRPRVLLADEVGLGKTIEACLILHRLHLAGRAQRILILVPEPLVHQWFVELLRRFQLSFKIFNEERADSIETEQPDANPFLEDQLVLCAVSWLAEHPNRAAQAAEAGWDLAIVDEAHHLEWTPEAASPAYQAVAAIAEKTPGLLLLTATPEQLGREGHFARLRLLDPDRFSDLGEFLKESERYAEISKLADQLLSGDKLPKKSLKLVEELLGAEAVPVAESDLVYREEGDSSLEEGDEEEGEGEAPEKQGAADDSGSEESESVGEADPETETETEADAGEEAEEPEPEPAAEPKTRADLARALIDLHGTGRVLFRNRRAVLQGFPKRIAEPAPVKDEDGAKLRWLAELLRAHPEEKFVLICATRELAESVEEGLREQISAGAGLFHEGLTLVQRDRNAAWFAQEDGARILICSEIGSEGRNFQFAHHLVLYDLPPDPALLEQRIGRLDRIGQTADIHIHIPYRKGTAEEFWMRWYHEGLGAFENTLHGSAAILREIGEDAAAAAAAKSGSAAQKAVIKKTQALKKKVDKELESGRDHLLELSSFDREKGETLAAKIAEKDADPTLEDFMLQMFDLFGVTVDDLEARGYILRPEHLFSADAFPGLPADGLSLTFDRTAALAREEIAFFTWDHPVVVGAIDSLLGSERGNASFVVVPQSGSEGLLLEVVFVAEPVAPPAWHADRFFPPTPLRIVVDHHRQNRTEEVPREALANAKPGPAQWLREKADPLRDLVPKLLGAARFAADKQSEWMRTRGMNSMRDTLDAEINRLQQLRDLGHPVPESEIADAKQQRSDLADAIRNAQIRVDSVRLILCGK